MDSLGDSAVHTKSILRPHGVFAVISPFNFPMALSCGPSAAAMLAGNTVVFKPSSAAPISGVKLVEAYRDAGVPDGVINLVMGPGETVGAELRENPGIDGIVFTGSYDVGMDLFRTFSRDATRSRRSSRWAARTRRSCRATPTSTRRPRGSCAAPSASAARSARPTAGSTSRRPVHDELVRLLVEKTEAITIGDPLLRENWLGPVIDQKAVDRHQAAIAEARRDGRVFTGGETLTDRGMDRGFYVEPTVVGDLPADHRLFRDELFAPFTAVAAVDSFDEAIRLANDSVYGLTAGVYSEDQGEVQQFLDTIQAGRAVRQPPGRRDDRRLAGRPGVRRLEGLGLDRQVRPVDVLRRPVPAGAEPHRRRLKAGRGPRRTPRWRRPA